MARRRIAFITGSRSEFGILRSVISAVRKHPKLELRLIVTGMHLLRRFGQTAGDIEREGWHIDARVPMYTHIDDPMGPSFSLSRGLRGLASALERLEPDMVVVLGDRLEAMAGALAAVTTERFVAHIHGGDVAPGHHDDSFRHSITKLSHFHFAATKDAARRIIRLGEEPKRVFVVGAPGLDELYHLPSVEEHWLHNRYQFSKDVPVALVIYHPIGRSDATERGVMNRILRAVSSQKLSGVVIYPNSDPGSAGIIRAIESWMGRADPHQWVCARSLPRDDFLRCLVAVRVIVGNSSCGVIEAHTAGTPAVNVGSRQQGRLRSGRCVFDCGETVSEIQKAVRKALSVRIRRNSKSAYGNATAGTQIAHQLARIVLSDKDLRKQITY